MLLHLNSARSGDTQRRQSYSSPANRGEGGGPCTQFALINVMRLWQSAPTNSSKPWYNCLFSSMRQMRLITACLPVEMEQGVGTGRSVAALCQWPVAVRQSCTPVIAVCMWHNEVCRSFCHSCHNAAFFTASTSASLPKLWATFVRHHLQIF